MSTVEFQAKKLIVHMLLLLLLFLGHVSLQYCTSLEGGNGQAGQDGKIEIEPVYLQEQVIRFQSRPPMMYFVCPFLLNSGGAVVHGVVVQSARHSAF